MFLLSLIAPSFACPTIATGTPSELSFDVARVAIARQDSRTTFTVSINPSGEAQEFALVLPVPALLQEDDIKTLDPEIFSRLNGYSAPRMVSDAGCATSGPGSSDGGGGGGGPGGDDTGSVVVEAEYLIGEYGIVILSATSASGLQVWLDDNGYYLPEGAEPRLQEYIDAESYFLGAKVADKAALANGEPLSPLQVAYDSEVFYIPIRLATLNSPGEQDMVIYAVTAAEDGEKDSWRTGIANYPEFDIADKCIWGDPSAEDFSGFYEDRFTEAWEAMGEGAWTVEYAGTWNDANPASSVSITADDIAALGFDEGSVSHHLTRLRMRYTPEQAVEDLIFYGSGIYEPEVTSFADDNTSNRDCIDLCGGALDTGGPDGTGGSDTDGGDDTNTTDGGTTDGGTTDGGTTDGGDDGVGVDTEAGDEGEGKEETSCSCAAGSGGPAGAWVLLIGIVGLVRRRRSVTL